MYFSFYSGYYTCTCICNRKSDIEIHEEEEYEPLFPETGLHKKIWKQIRKVHVFTTKAKNAHLRFEILFFISELTI